MKQARPQHTPGVTVMHPEVELLAITQPLPGYKLESALDGPDGVIIDAARTCYQTNERATEETDLKLLARMIRDGHWSVFEHACATFRVRGGSRALTHQLVRHRHTAYSQESQRYCDEGDFGCGLPPSIVEAGLTDKYHMMMEDARLNYLTLQKLLRQAIKAGEISEGYKVNEDARFVLPGGVQSEIVLTPNFTELRYMFLKRLTTHAQWEIRLVYEQILDIMHAQSRVFDDIHDYYKENGEMNGFPLVV
jgi:thymidylate synthase (FAD)